MEDERLNALRRHAVVEAALELFGRHGYDAAGGTGMQAIAAEAGVGPTTVYRLFGDRAGLHRAAAGVAAERFVGIVAAARQEAGRCEAPQERTRTFLLRLVAGIRRQPAVWSTLSDRPRDPVAAAAMTAARQRVRAAVIDGALADGRTGRALTDQQAEWAALFIYGGLAEILRTHLAEASAADDIALASFLAAVTPGWPASSR